MQEGSNGPELYIIQPDGSGLTLIQSFAGEPYKPYGGISWSPDAKAIVYHIDRKIAFVDVVTGAIEFYPIPIFTMIGPGSFSIDLEPTTAGYQGFLAAVALEDSTDGSDITLVPIDIAGDGTVSCRPVITPMLSPVMSAVLVNKSGDELFSHVPGSKASVGTGTFNRTF